MPEEPQLLVVEADRPGGNFWSDLWQYRELFVILAWRDIAVRYKQTVIGVLWAVLRPVLTMVIMVLVFGKIAGLPSEGVPYPIFVFSAMLPWSFFATSFSDAGNSLVANANLITKIYFPRIIIPGGAVIVAAVDLAFSCLVLTVLMMWYGYAPDPRLITLPMFMVLAVVASFGASLLVTSLNVRYRDVRHIIPFVVQIGLYISPVGFSTTLIPANVRPWYYLNPMVAVIDGFRWAISGGRTAIDPLAIVIGAASAAVLVMAGLSLFRRTERTFANLI